MQPLIRLRLLASQLKQHELQRLIQSLVESYSADQILSFIFSHFALKYQQTKQHDDDVPHMIQMISNILNARKKTQSSSDPAQITIDSIPSDMIGECASFLSLSDYISFSKCNRKIYIGCHSPATLQDFFLTDSHIKCNLDQFPLLKHLGLSVQSFNKYMGTNPMLNTLHNVRSLTVLNDYNERFLNSGTLGDTILTAIGNTLPNMTKIPVQNIRHLTCSHFGLESNRWCYDSKSFCNFLSGFTNLESLCLRWVFLDALDSKSIGNMFSKLRTLSARDVTNEPVLLLRDKLLELYSRQMVSIDYDESTKDISVTCFPKLKQLMIQDPNVDSLLKIVTNAPYLEHFVCEIPTLSMRTFNKKTLRNIIGTLFCKCVHCKVISMRAGHVQMLQIMKWMVNALRRNNTIGKQVTLTFTVLSRPNAEEIDEVMLLLPNLINALETQVDDFMLGIHFSKENPNVSEVFDKNTDTYKNQYLVYIYNDLHSMIISNKTCKINGYVSAYRYY
eukprot:1030519_1